MGGNDRRKGSPSNEFSKASISDLLYLISTDCGDVISPSSAENLYRAYMCIARGNFADAMEFTHKAIRSNISSSRVFKEIVAVQTLVSAMLDSNLDAIEDCRDYDAMTVNSSQYDPVRIVNLAVQSDRLWHSGDLLNGLKLNYRALFQSRYGLPLWRLHSSLLLIKKLTDMHSRDQAHRLINDLQDFIKSSGLEIFEALPDALRSLLHLQAGENVKALQDVATSLRLADRRRSTIGVKLALSVAAETHFGNGNFEAASNFLKRFNAKASDLVLMDSIVRATFVDIALVSKFKSPQEAAKELVLRWEMLGTKSACFAEDPTRAAWIITIAKRANNAILANRALDAINQLACRNREVNSVLAAEKYAQAAFRGEALPIPILLDSFRKPGKDQPKSDEILSLSESNQISQPLDLSATEIPLVTSMLMHSSSNLSPPLTLREAEIAELVARGDTNQQIARKLEISPHTVNFHLRNIFKKLSISSRAQIGYYVAHQSDPDVNRE